MVYTNMSVRIDNDGIYFNSELDDVACRIAVICRSLTIILDGPIAPTPSQPFARLSRSGNTHNPLFRAPLNMI